MKSHEIRQLRLRLGLSQSEFYDKLGLRADNTNSKQQCISRWENGKRLPANASLDLLAGLAEKAGGFKP